MRKRSAGAVEERVQQPAQAGPPATPGTPSALTASAQHQNAGGELQAAQGPTPAPTPDPTAESSTARAPPAKRSRKEVSYVAEVTDMMYVFGDAHIRNGTGEAATLMETIVRDYILNLLNEAATLVFRSGGSRITTEHIGFQVRRDAAKLNNLKEFLKWKEIRKNFAPDEGSGTSKAAVTKINVDTKKTSKASTHWSWEIMHDLLVPGDPLVEEDDGDSLDDDILTKPQFDSKNRERLRQADEMTKTMSKEEYMKYTEARKASFTYKKAKKFRDWLGPSISALKLNDDVIEVLGYLAWEMVGSITQLGLDIKKEAETHKTGYGSWRHKGGSILSLRLTPYQKDSEKTPLQALHVREAVRRTQHLRYSAVGFTASHLRKERFV